MTTGVRKQALRLGRPLAALVGGLAAMLAVGAAPSTAGAATTRPHSTAADQRQLPTNGPSYGSLTGVVNGAAGHPLAGACVTAVSQGQSVTVHTGSTGVYFFVALRPGPYTVRYASCTAAASPLTTSTAHVLVQAGRPIRLATVTLRPAVQLRMVTAAQAAAMRSAGTAATGPGTISGTVRGPGGKPLAGMCVNLWSVTAYSASGVGVSTGSKGTYSLAPADLGFPDHGLRIEFSAGCGDNANFAPQWWKHAASEAKATPLTVKAGDHLKNISATMTAGGQIAGVVRASGTEHALRGICVTPYPTSVNQSDFEFPAPVFTGSNGKYLLKGLPTGRYQLTFQPGAECGGASYGNADFIDYDYPHAVHVVAGKKITGIDVAMRLGAIITGEVTASGGPVTGACVYIAQGDSIAQESSTAKNGSYSISQLQPGRYEVGFSGGCGNKASYAPQYYPDQQNAAAAAPIAVGYGQTASGINASLLAGAAITGSVTNARGKPIANVCVQATPEQTVGGFTGSILAVVSQTNLGGVSGGKGGYSIPNLAAGAYYLQFSSCEYGNLGTRWYAPPGAAAPGLVSAVAGVTSRGIDVQMSAGGTITGTVKDPDGKLAGNGCVFVVPAGSSVLDALDSEVVNTSGRGWYLVNQLATGRYKIEFASCSESYAPSWYGGASFAGHAKIVPVTSGRTTRNINGTLVHGQSIRGRITSGVTGKPVAGMCVLADDQQGNPVWGGFAGRAGRYVVGPLAPGRYTLKFISCQYFAYAAEGPVPAPAAAAATPTAGNSPALAPITRHNVKVAGHRPTTGINEVLRPGGFIAGTVLGGAHPVVQPGICVVAAPTAGNGVAEAVATGRTGTYRIGPLAAGSYKLLFTADCSAGTAALASEVYPSAVTVTPLATVSGVDATLATDGQITGTVTNASSAAVAGECVTATPLASGSSVTAVTAADGGYSIARLVPGGYTVRFSAGCGAVGYQTQWWNDAASVAAATTVTLTNGGTESGINAQLSATP